MDLTSWDPEHYRCPTRWLLLMRFGAKCIRCEYCRNNFVSFRPAKYKFIRKRTRSAVAAEEMPKKSTLR